MREENLTTPRTFPNDPNPPARVSNLRAPTAAAPVPESSDAPGSVALGTRPVEEPAGGPTFQIVAHPDGSRRAVMSTSDFETVDMGRVSLPDEDVRQVLAAAGKDVNADLIDVDEPTVKSLLSGRLGIAENTVAKWNAGEVGLVQNGLGLALLEGSMTPEEVTARSQEEDLKVQLGQQPALAWRGLGKMAADIIRHPLETQARVNKFVIDATLHPIDTAKAEAKFVTEAVRFIVGESAEQGPNLREAAKASAAGAATGAAAAGAAVVATGTVLTPAGALAIPVGAEVGAAQGALQYFIKAETGSSAIEMQRKGYDLATIRKLAPVAGTIKGALEMASFGVMTAPFKTAFVKKVLATPAVNAALKSAMGVFVQTVGAEVGTEELQLLVDVVTNNMAAEVDNKPEQRIDGRKLVDQAVETAIKTAASVAGMGAAGAGVTALGNRAVTVAEKVAEKAMDAKIEAEVKGRATPAPLPKTAKAKDAVLPATPTEGAAVDRAALLPKTAEPEDLAADLPKDSGAPTLYHGTTQDITQPEGLFWMTEDPKAASGYADRQAFGNRETDGEDFRSADQYSPKYDEVGPAGQRVLRVNAGLTKPLDLREVGQTSSVKKIAELLHEKGISEKLDDETLDMISQDLSTEDVEVYPDTKIPIYRALEGLDAYRDIEKAGFDGVKIVDTDVHGAPVDAVAAFRAEKQVRVINGEPKDNGAPTPDLSAQLPQAPADDAVEKLLAAHAADNISDQELVDGVSESLPATPEDTKPGTKSLPRLEMEKTVVEKAKAAEVRALTTDITAVENELDALYADRLRRKAAGERLTNIDRQISALADRKSELEQTRTLAQMPPFPETERTATVEMKAATLADIADMAFTEGSKEAQAQARAEMAVAQEEFKAAKGELRAAAQERLNAAKEKFDALVENTKSRPKAVKAVIDANGLTAGEARRLLSDKKPLVTMSEAKFKEFLADFESRAQYAKEWKKARAVVEDVLAEKELVNESRIRAVRGLPSIDKMNVVQLEEYARTLSAYEKNDTILTEKLTQALQGTEMAGIDTMRGLVAAAAKILGRDPKEMGDIAFKDWYKYLPDTQLATKHPLLDFTVTYLKTAAREGTAAFLAFKEKNSALAAAAMQSRAKLQSPGQRFANWFLNQQSEVMAYIEEQDPQKKSSLGAALTPEEAAWADFWLGYSKWAYDYLLSSKALTGSRYAGTYVPHASRSFLETLGDIKSRGLRAYLKELKDQYTRAEEEMSAMDAKGNPLGYKAFLANTLRRTGGLRPTQNIASSMNVYAKKLSGKVAFDKVIPVIDATVQAVKAAETDPDIQKINDISHQFIKDLINAKKGNAKGLGLKQGGWEETVLRLGQAGASLAYIKLNFALQLASPIGATVAELPVLGNTGIALAKKRKYGAKGRAIIAKYQAFIGEPLKTEVFDPAKPVQERVWTATNAMWHVIHNMVMEDLLLGSMTAEEFAAGEISQARLTSIEKEAGRWIDIRGSKSVVGSSVAGASWTQFKSWMIPPIHTIIGDTAALAQAIGTLGKKPMTPQQMKEFAYMAEVYGAFYLAKSLAGEDDPDDDSFSARLRRYALGELGGSLNPANVLAFIAAPVGVSYLLRVGAALGLLAISFKESLIGDADEGEVKRERALKALTKARPLSKILPAPEGD